MSKTEREEFLSLIRALAEIHARELTGREENKYLEALHYLPMNALRKAILIAARLHFFPSPGDLYVIVQREWTRRAGYLFYEVQKLSITLN